MDHFTDRHADLTCESELLSAVADVVGTPVSVCPARGAPLGGVSGKPAKTW